MEKQDLKESVLTNLRSVTQSCKGGVPLKRLNRDYRDLLGSPIPFKELGYLSLEAFIKDIPHVICLRENQGEIFAEGVADNTTAHIVSLVSKQRQVKARPVRKTHFAHRRGGFSSRYSSRGSRSSYGTSSSAAAYQPSGKTKFPVDHHSKSQPTYKVSNSKSVNLPSKAPPAPSSKAPASSSRKYERPPRFQKLQKQKEVEMNRSSSPTEISPPSSSSRTSSLHLTSRTSPVPFSSSRTSPVPFKSSRMSPVHLNPTKNSSAYIYYNAPTMSRTVSGDSSLQTSDSDYNNHYLQRSLRPLLPKKQRVDLLKQLENIDNVKEYIYMYAEIHDLPVEYRTWKMGQKKESRGYTSVLKLGGKTYQSYPQEASCPEEAEDIAARIAIEEIQESKDYLATLPETPIRTDEEVQILIKNIEEIVCEKPSGMFSYGISNEYENMFKESLPKGWIEKVKESSTLDVEQVTVPYGRVPDGVSWIVRPARTFSSGSTTPSEVSAPQVVTNGGVIERHRFEHPLPKVPELVFPAGNEWGVYITSTSNYIAARLVDLDEEYLTFSKAMSSFYDSHSLPVTEVFEKQLYAFVNDENDGKVVQRLLVNKIQDEWIECYYVDEGFFAEVQKSQLQDLHDDFFMFPYQAVHLALDGLEDYEPFIKPDDLENIQDKTLIAVIKRFRTDDDFLPDVPGITKRVFSVVLFDTSDEDNDLCLNNYIKQSVLVSWECNIPKQGTSTQGYLTHVTETGEIYLRFHPPENSLLERELDRLSIEFEEVCLETPAISPHEIFVAKFTDGRWYRATLPEESHFPSNSDMIEVFFIDYGHPSFVKKSEICQLSPYSEFLASLGNQAIKCELYNTLPSPEYSWTEDATKALFEFAPFNEELIVMVIVEGSSGNLPKVNLHKRITSDTDSYIISINEKLSAQKHLFRTISDALQNPLKIPSNLNIAYNNTELLSRNYPSNSIRSPLTSEAADVYKTSCGIEWLMTPDNIRSPEAFEDMPSPSPLNPPQVPDQGEMFDVFVTIAATPHNFIVQPLISAKAMDELRSEMQKFYSTEENLLEMDQSILKKNCFYAALHSDGEWYRVRVVTITEKDPIMAAVYYVDFGDFGTISIQNLQLLCERFRTLPCQAIKAALAGIRPIAKDWNPVHCVKFKEMVTERNFVSIVKEKCLRDEQDFCCLELEVILIDTSDPEKDVYINDLLIDLLMAQRV